MRLAGAGFATRSCAALATAAAEAAPATSATSGHARFRINSARTERRTIASASASARDSQLDSTDWHGRTAGDAAIQCTPSVVAESRPQNPWEGLLTRKVRVAQRDSRPLRLPRLSTGWLLKRHPSLTVAGPRRIRTGFPLCPIGHPRRTPMVAHRPCAFGCSDSLLRQQLGRAERAPAITRVRGCRRTHAASR